MPAEGLDPWLRGGSQSPPPTSRPSPLGTKDTAAFSDLSLGFWGHQEQGQGSEAVLSVGFGLVFVGLC